MGSCDHANVLPYFGAYCRGDHVLAVLGYCVGSCTNVFQRLKRGFSETEVIAVLVQVLEGLVYLHSNRIVHRDLKCGNLLLMEDGTATIADFGVSSQLRTAESRCGAYCGHTTYHLQFELALGWRCSSVVTPCLEGHTHYLSRARALSRSLSLSLPRSLPRSLARSLSLSLSLSLFLFLLTASSHVSYVCGDRCA